MTAIVLLFLCCLVLFEKLGHLCREDAASIAPLIRSGLSAKG